MPDIFSPLFYPLSLLSPLYLFIHLFIVLPLFKFIGLSMGVYEFHVSTVMGAKNYEY
jgi:hypothetical protein